MVGWFVSGGISADLVLVFHIFCLAWIILPAVLQHRLEGFQPNSR